MSKQYRTSGVPMVASNTVDFIAERGKNSRTSVNAFNTRLRADRTHKTRSEGQKRRQARERLYGKDSHLVQVRRIEGWEPK